MIIIDYSAIAISAILSQDIEPEEDMIRHMVLNSIRMHVQKFSKKYGDIVIAADNSSWRKEYFPEYKANRKTNREESTTIDWDEIFRVVNLVLEELDEYSPYKVIKVKNCEADDIIGTLCEYTQEFGKHEPVMIISGDKDFIQLHKFKNVAQYSPTQKKFVTHKDPAQYLIEHVFKGDSGDGVPNVLSSDDTFIEKIRQKPVTKKKIELWTKNLNNLQEVMSNEEYKNYTRNSTVIDLSKTPVELKEKIIEEFEKEKESTPTKTSFMRYLISKRCKQLISCIEEFYSCR